MPSLIDSLKTRYEAVFQSDTDSRFYQNLHHYFDLVIKNPTLNKIYHDSEDELREKHIAIWEHDHKLTDEEADDREERTFRLERFNLYSRGCFTEAWVYQPLEDYKNSIDESEIDQDPSAVLMMRGVNNINPEHAKKYPAKWGKDKLRNLNHRYEGKRVSYEAHLRQFHLLLVAAVEAQQSEQQKQAHVHFDPETGKLIAYAHTARFNQKTQAYRVLDMLWKRKNNQATFDDLLRAMAPKKRDIYGHDHNKLHKVIRNIRRAIGTLPKRNDSTPDILKNIPSYGYQLVLSDETKSEEA